MLIASQLFWGAMIFLLTISLILLLYKQFFFEKGHAIHKVFLVAYAAYLGALFILILFPPYMFRPFQFSLSRVNLIPFKSFHSLLTNPKEPIGNILLFMPFGFFSVLNDRVKAGRRLLNVLWRTALISVVMEGIQTFIGRVTDIDDVIINTIGGVIGGIVCIIWHKTRLDHTHVGEKLMPELPKKWRGKMAVPLLSVLMLVVYGGALFAVNAYVTRDASKQYDAKINGSVETITLEADNAVLWDCAEEKAIFENNTEDVIYPASTIKLVTCLTALDIVSVDDNITAGKEILRVPFNCSRAGISMGTAYTAKELIAGALLCAGADACYTLSVYCGRQLLDNPRASVTDALSAFIEAANKKLKTIGAINTVMLNVEGMDEEGQTTTAYDLLKITSAVLANPVLSEICRKPEMVIGPENNSVTIKNTNKILCSDSEYYDESFIGVKTGTTSLAGNCLISAFVYNGKEYICVIMHSSYEGKFKDTLTLADLVKKS